MSRLGLALSGGGFRASLYHLGLVRFLRDAGRLRRVTHITSVSGGSVLAAHLALNWDRYTGTEDQFDAAAAEVLAFVRMDVRNRIIRRYPLALPAILPRRLLGKSNRKLGRTWWLEWHYQKYLYGDTSLFQLPESPQLHLLTTNLSEGCLCSFNRHGMIVVRRQPGNAVRLDRVHMGLATVAMAVTASSAFPGFFPPLVLTAADVGATGGEFDRQSYTDGAVFDNLGVRMFGCLERRLLADGGLTSDDFLDFPAVFEALRQANVSGAETPLHRLTQLLATGGRHPALPGPANGVAQGGQAATEVPVANGPPADGEGWLLARLAHVLRHSPFDRDPHFGALTLADPDAAAALKDSQAGRRALTADDQFWLNRHLFDAAFRQATGRGCFRRLNSGLDGVLVSDVGKSFEVHSGGYTGGLIRTAMRSSDILINRVWQLEIETFSGTPGFVFAPITDVIQPAEDPTALHPEVQRQVATIRTDLDRFSELEISTLVRHGYCVARRACRSRPDVFGDSLPDGPPWDPVAATRGGNSATAAGRPGGPPRQPATATAEARALQGSAPRRIWSRLLSPRDWVSYLYVPILVPILLFLPYFGVKYYQRAHRQSVLIQSLAQGNRDVEVMSRLLEQGPEPLFAGAPAEDVTQLEEPDLTGFTIIQDSWIMDLRRWSPDATDRHAPGSYAYHSRRLMVSKETEDAGRGVFRWRVLSRDPAARFRFPRQELTPTLQRCLDPKGAGPERLARWEVGYDVRNVPVGQPVNLLVEHQGVGMYLRANANSTTVPLNVRADTGELTAWVMMPEGREYANFRVSRHTGKNGAVERVNVVTEYLADDATILAFKLLSLKAGQNYEVSWTYK